MAIVPYLDGLDYGVGVNSLSGEALGDGIVRTPAEAPPMRGLDPALTLARFAPVATSHQPIRGQLS